MHDSVTLYTGFVNTLLSWKAWAPLSRLTYGVYLVHLVVLNVLAGNFKRPFYMDGWSGVSVPGFLSTSTWGLLHNLHFSRISVETK